MKNKTILVGDEYDFLCGMYHNVTKGNLFVGHGNCNNDHQYNEYLKDFREYKEARKEKNIKLFND